MKQSPVQVQQAATPSGPVMDAVEEIPGPSMQEIADQAGGSRGALRSHINHLPDHPTRQEILEYVCKDPGIHLADLRRRIGCSWGALHHHVQLLSRERRIRTHRWNRSRRLFPARTKDDDKRALTLLQSGRVREIVEEIRDRPGIIQRDLTDGLGVSRKVLRRYIDLLKAEGLLEEIPVSRTRTYFATPELDLALAQLDEAGEPKPARGFSRRPHTP